MKLSVIIPIFNRVNLFTLGLKSLVANNFPKNDWELIVVDDRSTMDVSEAWKDLDINVKHIRIDPQTHHAYRGYHTPALAINIGIKHASGDVICITQPEILHDKENLQRGYDQALQNTQVFGKVMLTTGAFTKTILQEHNQGHSFDVYWADGLEKAGHVFPDNELYWYVYFVKKTHALAVHGVDEEYLKGVYAEDDDFKERLRIWGILPELNRGIRGIHIDHSFEKDLYKKQDRTAYFWAKGAEVNRKRFYDWLNSERTKADAVANGDDWGSDKYVEWIKGENGDLRPN